MLTKHLDKYVLVQIIIILAILFSTPFGRINLHTTGLVAGIALLCSGAIILILASKELGAAFAPQVSPVQNGKLVTSGVYSIVRHPMYSGIIVMNLGWFLLWGSLFALIFSILLGFLFAFKSEKEEILLSKKYQNYADYKARVNNKFIPYIY